MTVTTDMVRLTLPMPPSTNNLFLNVRGRGRIRSENYRKWSTEAGHLLKAQRPPRFTVPVGVTVEINPPNGRAFDLDNRMKGILDLLVEHQVIPDDSRRWVRDLRILIVETGAPCTVQVEAL